MAHALRAALLWVSAAVLAAAGLLADGVHAPGAAGQDFPAPHPALSVARRFPARYAAPYLQVSRRSVADMTADLGATGLKYYTLAFLTPTSGCTLKWDNGDPVGAFSSAVNSLRAAGGDVIISFGGASGGELAQTCRSVPSLTAAYAGVVKAYGVTRLDFDLEGAVIADTAANARRDQALAALQRGNPDVQINYTVPVDRTGLNANALNLLRDAESNQVRVNLVNLMAMDFGDGHNVLADAESAALAASAQLGGILSGLSVARGCSMIGLTVIAGKNDDWETFTSADAVALEAFAAAWGVRQLGFWELDGYDKCTHYTYSQIFNKLTG